MDEIKQTSWGHARFSLWHVRPSSYPDIVYPFIYKIQQTTIPERRKQKKSCIGIKKQKANGKFLLYLVNFNLFLFHSSRVLLKLYRSLHTHTFEKRNLCIFSADTHTCLGELFVAHYTQAIVSPYMGIEWGVYPPVHPPYQSRRRRRHWNWFLSWCHLDTVFN